MLSFIDGYKESTTKFMTHQRRATGIIGVDITFTDEMKLSQKKDEFLSNSHNKQRFVNLLGEYLQRHGCVVHHARGDADLLIVTTAVQCAKLTTTVLVGDDTDLIVLLCFYVDMEAHDLFMYSQSKSSSHISRVWNIKSVREKLGCNVCEAILFIHAVGGCDTTSRLYGIGKGTPLKKYASSKVFQDSSKVFNRADVSVEQIAEAGERALVVIYGGKITDNLNSLRYKKFCEKTASKSSHILSQSLPPTTASARYHSLRVYLQVQQWRGVTILKPVEWGWRLTDDHLVPNMTDLPPAPDRILHVIHCGCSTDCSSGRCTCRKNNLECSTACSQCRGTSCSNSTIIDDDDLSDSENM